MEGKGYQCKPVLSWDTNSGKKTPQVLERLELLPQIAEQQLCSTAKDVSNAGLLGTIALMMETSEAGARINIDAVPRPESFALIDWLKAFLSYGFVLCVDKNKSTNVVEMFEKKNITASIIGTVTEERTYMLEYQGSSDMLFDLGKEDITGIARDYGLQNM
jgi:selenophosphate synthetase-related protein